MLPLLLMHAAAPASLPACKPGEMSLVFDGEYGAFDGMSHSGTLLILRNIGSHPCTVPGLPRIVLKDRQNKVLPIERRAPVGMHPGPVIAPVGVPAGAELTTTLRWVTGPVYRKNRCYDVAFASVDIGNASVPGKLAAHICGEAGQGTTFSQAVLTRDSVLP